MEELAFDDFQSMGLRERKKAKTRAAIAQHALRLFREQGYSNTTVEQIAEAAEISQSTFFRYFPTKEDVVLSDDYDPMIIEAINAQPANQSPIQAVRNAFLTVSVFGVGPEMAAMRERIELIFSVPELRAAMLDNLTQSMKMFGELIAKRVGRDPNEFVIRTFVGALEGVLLSAMFHWRENPELNLATLLDESLAYLEAGLPL